MHKILGIQILQYCVCTVQISKVLYHSNVNIARSKYKKIYWPMSLFSHITAFLWYYDFNENTLVNKKKKDLVLVCYRNYRYPGCTTRTSVPSQPTALQKPPYKKEPYLQNKNTTTTADPTQHHHHHQHHPSYKKNRPTKKKPSWES